MIEELKEWLRERKRNYVETVAVDVPLSDVTIDTEVYEVIDFNALLAEIDEFTKQFKGP